MSRIRPECPDSELSGPRAGLPMFSFETIQKKMTKRKTTANAMRMAMKTQTRMRVIRSER
jgi:hypothetical protein